MAEIARSKALVPALMGLLFFGPLALAILLYNYGSDYWRPAGSTVHGTLIANPRTLPAGPQAVPGTNPVRFDGRWSLIYIGGGDCGSDCREALYRTRQVRRALGKEMSRVQRFLVVAGDSPDAAFLQAEHPELIVLGETSPLRPVVLAAVGESQPGDIFVADPIGNVILRFAPGTTMKDMHNDLTVLLKASSIG